MTSAQRARLVVALGVLNLVLASFAFAVGIGAPRLPDQGIAAVSAAPSPPLTPAPSIPPGSATPPASEAPSAGPSQPLTSPQPSPQADPDRRARLDPGPDRRGDRRRAALAAAVGRRINARRLEPGRDAAAHRQTQADADPHAGIEPTPKPSQTAHPTPKPSPTAKPPKPTPPPPPPAAQKDHPPCPQAVDGPPGHNKGQTGDQPCGKGKGSGGDKGKGGSNDGAIIVLPLALSAALAGGRNRAARSLRRRRSAR